jgi:hypothetical protein
MRLTRRIEKLEQRSAKIESDAAKAEEDAIWTEAARELGVLPGTLRAIAEMFPAEDAPGDALLKNNEDAREKQRPMNPT